MIKYIIITIFIFFLAAFSSLASELTGTINTAGGVIPLNPSNVTAAKTGDTQITVGWSAVEGADGYRVYRIKNGGASVLIADNLVVLTYVNSGLDEGNYSYQVQSFKGTLAQNTVNIPPTAPITISIPTSTSTPSPSGGGGGGSVFTPTPTSGPLSQAAQAVDVNNDNKINVLDFNTLMVNWGSTSQNNVADFNNDSIVNILDFNALMVYWTG